MHLQELKSITVRSLRHELASDTRIWITSHLKYSVYEFIKMA